MHFYDEDIPIDSSPLKTIQFLMLCFECFDSVGWASGSA